MGSIVKAYCGCGYERLMPLGGGMMNFTAHCNFPVYCPKCKVLFEANLVRKAIKCPECGDRNVLSYENDELCRKKGEAVFEWNLPGKLGGTLKLTDGKYLCPKCGKYTMSFSDMGNWD